MTREYLSVISDSLKEIESVYKNNRCVPSNCIEPRYIRVTIRSSVGVFDQMLGIVAIERVFLRIGNILNHALNVVPGFDVSVTFYHLGDDLPCIPSVNIYIFTEDILYYCRRHH